MQANRRRRRAEWEFLVETNVSGGQYHPDPESEEEDVVEMQSLLFQCEGAGVSTRGDSSRSRGNKPDDGDSTTNLQNNNGDYDETEYDADTDTTAREDDTDEESDDGQNLIILSDDEDLIFAATASILVAESKQRFASNDSDNDDDVRSLNSFVVFDDPRKITPANKPLDPEIKQQETAKKRGRK